MNNINVMPMNKSKSLRIKAKALFHDFCEALETFAVIMIIGI